MKRSIIAIVVLAAIGGGGYYYYTQSGADGTGQAAAGGAPGGRGGNNQGGGFGGGGFGGPGGGGGGFGGQRPPMTVETAAVKRGDMIQNMEVVGNLIGAATVEAVPKVGGRLESVTVRLGDPVKRGQRIAKIEDHEIQEQVKQAQASFEVSGATIRQREADLKLAQTNLDRARNLFERQLIPRQTLDDTEARYQAAVAQLDLAKAQFTQTQARLDELKINLDNTILTSPVSGFVGRRMLDPGAWVTPNSAFISVVDIGIVRLVANIVEKDLRRITTGMKASVSVDAFPDETFEATVAHVAPVLDPSTRTAQIEVEINNAKFRLKPGMYAKVSFTVEHKEKVLTLPANAIVDLNGKKGVFMPGEKGDTAHFQAVTLGMVQPDVVEIADGLAEGTRVVTTGATALRDGDRIVLLGQGGGGRGGGRGRGGNAGRGAPAEGGGAAPASAPGGGAAPANVPGGGQRGGASTRGGGSPEAGGESGGQRGGRRGGAPTGSI